MAIPFQEVKTMMSDASTIINNSNGVLNINIYSRFGLIDRMGDGFVEPPNRRAWAFEKLFDKWQQHQYFSTLTALGRLFVSYNNINDICDCDDCEDTCQFNEFIVSANSGNRHQVIALSHFLATNFANDVACVSSPHENSGTFTAVFKRIKHNEVAYIANNGTIVRFYFDSALPSQF